MLRSLSSARWGIERGCEQLDQEGFLREVPWAGPESKQRLKGIGREEVGCSVGDGGWDRDRRSRGLRLKTDVGVRMHEAQGAASK